MINLIIFPSDFFEINKVDEDLLQEYNAVVNTGLFDTVFFSYDKWFNEGKLVLSKNIKQKRKAIYRGWMMKPEQYELFYEKLNQKNVELITTPNSYEKLHIFPNVYHKFGTDTAKIMTFPLHKPINVNILKKEFDKFIVKDYVKSVKGTDFPCFFDNSITQQEFDNWMKVFYKYRSDLLTGGICIKEYLELKKYNNKTNEYRVFYGNGQILTISQNSAQPNYAPQVPLEIAEKYKDLESPYYTVDFAELKSGDWKVIEAGDGSVSGLSENQDIETYYKALYYCFI